MDDVGDDEIRLLDHPSVPVSDCEALRDGLGPFWDNSIGVVGCIEFSPLFQNRDKKGM